MTSALLDYVLKVTVNEAPPAADKSYLKRLCVVVKPKTSIPAQIVYCTNATAIADLTDNTDAAYALQGGLSGVYILPNANLEIANLVQDNSDFYSILVSSDFSDNEAVDLNTGKFPGVLFRASTDDTIAEAFGKTGYKSGFYDLADNKAANLAYGIGSFLNADGWINDQYAELPKTSAVTTSGEADDLFSRRVSFGLTDPQYGNRLAFFAVGGKAVIYPYVLENLRVDLQSKALQVFALNHPQYTLTDAVLLQNKLQQVIDQFITNGWIDSGTITITLGNEAFVANGVVEIPEPSAMWRAKITLNVGGN